MRRGQKWAMEPGAWVMFLLASVRYLCPDYRGEMAPLGTQVALLRNPPEEKELCQTP